MCTDNPIISKNTLNSCTIFCMQKRADKKIVTEEDIIEANKLAFNDDIGTVTNHVTSMFEVLENFEPGSKEYETLQYRIMCGQLYQQNTIDRAKGIIAKPMPEYWFSIRDNIVKEDDDADVARDKAFNRNITAALKPYFMTYVYPSLRKKNNTYLTNSNCSANLMFEEFGISSIQDLQDYEPKTKDMKVFLDYYKRFMPVGNGACVVNRICWIFENIFDGYLSKKYVQPQFDYTILKTDAEYNNKTYNLLLQIYQEYKNRLDAFQSKTKNERIDSFDILQQKQVLANWFKRTCEEICPNEDELCNILLDMCYQSEKSKQFVWDICGEKIISNLHKKNNGVIHYPVKVKENEDFEYCGEKFKISKKVIGDNDDNT